MRRRAFAAIRACAALAISVCMSAKAHAAVVIKWGGLEYVGTTKPFNDGKLAPSIVDWDGDGLRDDYGMRQPFSEATPLSPAADYTTPSGKSGLFYGGYDQIQLDNKYTKPIVTKGVFGNGAGDQITYQVTPAYGSAHLAIAFLKDDFLNLGDENTNYLDAEDTSISVNFASLPNMVGRFMVRNGTQWYLSEATITAAGLSTLVNPSQRSRWAIYNPTATLDFDASAATFVNLNLDDVQGAGYYCENDNIPMLSPAGAFLVEMVVNANFEPAPTPPPVSGMVPLPSAAWAGLALLGGVVARRAVRRRA